MNRRKGQSFLGMAGILLLWVILLSACAAPGNNHDDNKNEPGEGSGAGGQATAEISNTVNAAGTPQQASVSDPESAWLASMLINANVLGAEEQLQARVNGLLLDAANGQVLYIVLGGQPLGGRRLLAPWWALQMNSVEMANENTPGLQVHLLVSETDLAGAPDFSEDTFTTQENPNETWDAATRAYWAERSGNQRAEGIPDNPGEPVFMKGEGLQSINYDLLSEDGERIGDIKDLVIGSDGLLRYAIVEVDQPAMTDGLEHSMTVVAWGDLAWTPDQRAFRLMHQPEALRDAPRIDLASPPDFSLPGWDREWASYWINLSTNSLPTQTAEAGEPAVPVGEWQLLGQTLTTNRGEKLGVVEDWLVDGAGQVEFIAVTTLVGQKQDAGSGAKDDVGQSNQAREINPGGKWVLVPWSVNAWDAKTGSLEFLESADVFNNAPAFADAQALDTLSNWAQPVSDYWQEVVTFQAQTDQTPEENDTRVWISSLISAAVNGIEEQTFGIISGLLLDSTANLRYLVLGDGQLYKLLPWAYLERDPESGRLLFTDDPQRLSESPVFASLEAAQNIDVAQDNQLRALWGMK